MALTHLLDTSVFYQPIKDSPLPGVLERWSVLGDRAVATSAVCMAEVLQGLEGRGSEKYWRRFRELLEDRYPVLPFDERTARVFTKLAAESRTQGRARPALDLQIAATAVHHGLIVATLNIKHFTDLPGVRVEDWSSGD
ncbi:MAG: type II toxin-antitoxin system VapC family toxin [Kiritimatiellae bacterium]|nr:type II toxin-antitoxin system VapC family toxin [Kiritimatiellia bacterium]